MWTRAKLAHLEWHNRTAFTEEDELFMEIMERKSKKLLNPIPHGCFLQLNPHGGGRFYPTPL